MRSKILCVVMLVSVLSCGTETKRMHKALRPFPEVQVPTMIDNAEDALEYAVMHWWDEFLAPGGWYSDSLTVNGVAWDALEMVMGSYAECMSELEVPVAARAGARLFSLLEDSCHADTLSTAYSVMTALVEKYFYDPNSPFRNEDIYLPFVRGVAASDLTPDDMRASYAHTAEMCAMNAYGSPVPDFRFKDIKGRMHRLYEVKAPHTLLFFSNPGCYACRAIMEKIMDIDGVDAMIDEGRLAVVNIYIDDDVDAWREYQAVYPRQWLNGYDPDLLIRNDRLYNVRAIPSLYLLDADKKVIMRDAPEQRVFHWLESNK